MLLGRRRAAGALALLALVGTACSSNATAKGGAQCQPSASPQVTLAAYSNVYDVYGKLISNFQSDWKDKHDGQSVQFLTSFGGSTTQAEAVVNGLDADVVALSLDPDVELIQKAGLITHDWQNAPDHSIVGTSDVVFDVRPGNPKHIENWNDLTQPGLQILTPDPAQSGGAKWNIVAAYGAAMRGKVPGYKANDPADAERLLEGIFRNVTVLDKSANDSLKNFDSGNGDVAITYEYAALQARAAGGQDQIVYPPSTVSIQTPASVVDKVAKADCVLPQARAFVDFLHTPDAEAVYTSVGLLRPVDVTTSQKGDGKTFAPIQDLFTVQDLGGWDQIQQRVFGTPNGIFTKAFAASH